MSDAETPHGRWSALTIASAGYFFVLLDVTIVNVALARIGAGLGGSRSELQWVVDAYALVLAAMMLGGPIDNPAGWTFLALAGTGMGFAVPALVAGATEALGPDRAGVAAAVNNTARQVGGAIARGKGRRGASAAGAARIDSSPFGVAHQRECQLARIRLRAGQFGDLPGDQGSP